MRVMPSPLGIGLMTLIAISGCSVMLLVLGRQKLVELKKDCCYCLQPKLKQDGALGSHSCEHQQQQHAEGGAASITWRMQSGSQSSPDKKQNFVKKVRFSKDVVEPSSDSAAYRRRHALAFETGAAKIQMPENICHQNKMIDNSKSDENQRIRALANIPANRMALYVGICNDRSRRRLLH